MMDPEQKSVAQEFDHYHQTYQETVDAALGKGPMKVDFFTRIKVDYFLDILRSKGIMPESSMILDLGCGVGIYHRQLKTAVKDLIGVDVSSECLEQAQKMNPDVNYLSYDGDKLPFDDNSFDAGLIVCVMHHVPVKGRDKFLTELYRVLKPNGIAVIFEHNPLNPLTMRVVNNCPFDADAVLLHSKEMNTLLAANGFIAPKSKFILSFPPANNLFRGIDKLFSWLPFGAQYYSLGQKQ